MQVMARAHATINIQISIFKQGKIFIPEK